MSSQACPKTQRSTLVFTAPSVSGLSRSYTHESTKPRHLTAAQYSEWIEGQRHRIQESLNIIEAAMTGAYGIGAKAESLSAKETLMRDLSSQVLCHEEKDRAPFKSQAIHVMARFNTARNGKYKTDDANWLAYCTAADTLMSMTFSRDMSTCVDDGHVGCRIDTDTGNMSETGLGEVEMDDIDAALFDASLSSKKRPLR